MGCWARIRVRTEGPIRLASRWMWVNLEGDADAGRGGYRRSMNSLPGRDEAVLAVVCGAWAAFFLATENATGLWVAPLFAFGVLAYRRLPVVASMTVAILDLGLTLLLDVSSENPGSLAALFVVVYGLGRYPTAMRSIVPLTVLLLAMVVADPSVPTVVFGCVLLGAVWSFGAAVRRRTQAAEDATAKVERLAQVDPAMRAEQAVAEERARLAGETLAVIRAAVVTMLQHAECAAAELDRTSLEAIQSEGRKATSELRRLLGLLRSEPERGGRPPAHASRSEGISQLATAAGLIAVCLVEIGVTPDPVAPLSVATVALSLLLAAAVALRRRDPGLACTAATLPPVLALALDMTLPYGLWTAVVAGLLGWSVATRGQWRDRAALGLFAGVLVLDVQRHHPGNEAMMLVVVALAVIAGHVWATRDRDERSASTRMAALRAEHDAVAEHAVRSERLRLAHELHDVTSHAVGVMVLQAGAAAAMRDRDPEPASAAVANVKAAGTQALSELDLLFDLLDAGAVGPSGLAAGSAPSGLAERVEALVVRMRDAGLRISLVGDGPLPEDPELTAAAYRVVQEALTNVMRHAPSAQAEVELTAASGSLRVRVRDDGSRSTPPSSEGAGFGLVGLEERVRAVGGELVIARHEAAGFVVEARLPLAQPSEVSP
jgi:signal transduction histidine kinase